MNHKGHKAHEEDHEVRRLPHQARFFFFALFVGFVVQFRPVD
jgi:hypothetical protein